MLSHHLDPYRIPSNFRYQNYINEEIEKAKALLENKKPETLTSLELANLTLIFLETGDWLKVMELSTFLALELSKKQNAQYAEDKARILVLQTKILALKKRVLEPKILQEMLQEITQLLSKSPKELDITDKEIKAKLYYSIAVMYRENNYCDEAIKEFDLAEDIAQSAWLKSNIMRNRGLVYLKLGTLQADAKRFEEAARLFEEGARIFKEAYEFVLPIEELRGSLPALKNYWALTLSRAALARGKYPEQGRRLFEETSALYQTIFAEKNFTPEQILKCHDWQSHQFHRAMILCEMTEAKVITEKTEIQKALEEAVPLFLGVLEGRLANRADNQRVGDAYEWLGRTYFGLNRIYEAQKYFKKSLAHYIAAFSSLMKDGKEAPQIIRVKNRLRDLISARDISLRLRLKTHIQTVLNNAKHLEEENAKSGIPMIAEQALEGGLSRLEAGTSYEENHFFDDALRLNQNSNPEIIAESLYGLAVIGQKREFKTDLSSITINREEKIEDKTLSEMFEKLCLPILADNYQQTKDRVLYHFALALAKCFSFRLSEPEEFNRISSNILRNWALLHIKRNENAQAKALFHLSYEIASRSENLADFLPAVAAYIGLSAGKNGDVEESEKWFAKAHELYQQFPEEELKESNDYDSLFVHEGRVLLQWKQYKAAVEVLTLAVERRRRNLGEAEEYTKKTRLGAVEDLLKEAQQKLLEQSPSEKQQCESNESFKKSVSALVSLSRSKSTVATSGSSASSSSTFTNANQPAEVVVTLGAVKK